MINRVKLARNSETDFIQNGKTVDYSYGINSMLLVDTRNYIVCQIALEKKATQLKEASELPSNVTILSCLSKTLMRKWF